MKQAIYVAGLSVFAALTLPASATDLAPIYGTLNPKLYELRLGVYVHDPLSPERGSADINGELLANVFGSSSAWSVDALIPKLHAGATLAFGGRTSNVYAGFTWTFDVIDALFVEAAFGGAVNNGYTGPFAPPGHNSVGCHASFHEEASLGYRLSPEWSVLATVEHFSNAGLCDANRGVTNFGARLAYHF